MYPYPFDYVRPDTLEEALVLAQEDGMKFLAGGQSLLPLLNLHVAEIKGVIDLQQVAPRLKFIEWEQDHVVLGSFLTHEELHHASLLGRRCPLFPMAAACIGHPRIRQRGTLGGSLAHADPLAEWLLVMTLLEGKVILTSSQGERQIPFQEYLLGPMMTVLDPGELIVAVDISLPEAASYGFVEMSRRPGDYALVAAGVSVLWDQDRIAKASIAVSGISDVPLTFPVITRNLSDEYPSLGLIDDVKRAIEAEVDPPSDILADASYRRHLAATLVGRALYQAFDDRVQGQRLMAK
ncbi:FAD binding domain-containing protein [Sulfobacillus thermosulfidooxidans]|uniref:FAD binding domain-containing protein n=1 Tax=Sulfobacillus thermosulfidooxidans TaxID=28034 RepID=UPI0003F6345E|nr:FAD binding domain-containing protein [Sulfobacillus thermosulfidooxidans]